MSDPIRSISQNNFILADQKEVSHDNTLSGNGTAESPLGVSDGVMVSSKLDVTNNKITGYDGVPIGGSSYSAGSGIDITSGVISIDPTVVPSKTDLQGKLDTSAYVAPVNSDWNATSGLAEILNKPDTEELVAGTGIAINSGVIYVSGQYLTQADLAGYATQTWVGQQGYLTSIPSTYATDSEVAEAVAAGTSGKQNKLTSINDVQLVNALPASPVATTLYLIPEA